MRVLGLIVARGGSKGLPRKNVLPLGDHPLVGYAAKAAVRAKSLSKVIISTDDREIADAAAAYGAEVPFLRPARLADDTSPVLETVLHALTELERTGSSFDAVCLLQPTTPFRTPADIDAAVAILDQTPDADSVVAVAAVVDQHPRRLRRIENGWLVQYLPDGGDREGQQRQDHSDDSAYRRNGALYLTRRLVLMEQRSLYGSRVLPYLMPENRSVNIDSLQDLLLARAMLAEKSLTNELNPIRAMFE
jgi:CMP-N,N'-diacetyllegionaminic acid synthase